MYLKYRNSPSRGGAVDLATTDNMSSPQNEKPMERVVDWEGTEDAMNPRNWKKGTKTAQVLCTSAFTLYSNLAAIMFVPGAPALVIDFQITSTMVATLTVSIYLLGFVFGPFSLPSLSELYGRFSLYHICNITYLAFTIGCALSTNLAMFLVFSVHLWMCRFWPYSDRRRHHRRSLRSSRARQGYGFFRTWAVARTSNWTSHRWLRHAASGRALDLLADIDAGKSRCNLPHCQPQEHY
jgi:hypothetical protein